MNDFKNSINGFPIDNELKMLIANTVINKMESIGFEPTSKHWRCLGFNAHSPEQKLN